MFKCNICSSREYKIIDFTTFALPTYSRFPSLHEFDNYICNGCGVVSTWPQIDEESLVNFYNSDYRKSSYKISFHNKIYEPIIQIPWSGISFIRAQNFVNAINMSINNSKKISQPDEKSKILDVGAYQGFFLSALQKIYGSECMAYDYNKNGITFAKNIFGISNAEVAINIYTDRFDTKFDYITLVHVFEHLRDPRRYLRHVRNNLLHKNGLLYLEIPNVYGHPLDDPTHFYMYDKKSLNYVLEKEGFEIVSLFTSGFPEINQPSFSNTHQNIICTAILATDWIEGKETSSGDRANGVYQRIKKNHRRIGRYAIIKQGKKLTISFVKFFVFLIGGMIIDMLPMFIGRKYREILRSLSEKT